MVLRAFCRVDCSVAVYAIAFTDYIQRHQNNQRLAIPVVGLSTELEYMRLNSLLEDIIKKAVRQPSMDPYVKNDDFS